MTLEDVVDAYDRAWNEADPTSRRDLIEKAWREDGTLLEPRGRFEGRDAILERIAGFRQRFPGARVDITSGIDAHNGFVRYGWTIRAGDGAVVLEGIDVCELAPDGRLQRVVMFFGEPPPR